MNEILFAVVYVLIFLLAPQACATPLEEEIGLRRMKYQNLIKCYDIAFLFGVLFGWHNMFSSTGELHMFSNMDELHMAVLEGLWKIEVLGFLFPKAPDKMDECVYKKGYDGIFKYSPNN